MSHEAVARPVPPPRSTDMGVWPGRPGRPSSGLGPRRLTRGGNASTSSSRAAWPRRCTTRHHDVLLAPPSTRVRAPRRDEPVHAGCAPVRTSSSHAAGRHHAGRRHLRPPSRPDHAADAAALTGPSAPAGGRHDLGARPACPRPRRGGQRLGPRPLGATTLGARGVRATADGTDVGWRRHPAACGSPASTGRATVSVTLRRGLLRSRPDWGGSATRARTRPGQVLVFSTFLRGSRIAPSGATARAVTQPPLKEADDARTHTVDRDGAQA
jgi:hypothetical protein